MPAPALLIVARVRKAVGLHGALLVEPLTDTPAEVLAAGRRLLPGTVEGERAAGEPLTIVRSEIRPGGALAIHVAEISDRTTAEHWRGRYLLAAAADLAPPSEDEVYVHELPGMEVALSTGATVGTVREVYELPQGLALELEHDGHRILVPFRHEFVQAVDRAARRIVITPPDGLLD